ncbi:MAG TPA: hypothetical protein V6C89_14250 [Drouetiella sp.]|jgi:hypothetical protein
MELDPSVIFTQDFVIIIVVPLTIYTLKMAWEQRHSLWDVDLTTADRHLLMQITMFVIMPIVVFFHECGHAVATLMCGGKIAEFHYGVLWGYVRPSGFFTAEQELVILLAGSGVQIAIGLLAFIISLFTTSPPVVALLTYVALWSIAGTAIVYAMMSALGMYGDWQLIYSSSVTSWIPYIATTHAIIVIALLYAFVGRAPALWFAARTRPNWENTRQLLLDDIKAAPRADLYLDLGWHYYSAGLLRFADEAADTALKMSPEFADPIYLKAWVEVERSKIERAQAILSELSHNPHASPVLQARSLMAIGQLEERLILTRAKNGPVPPEQWKKPLDAFTAAIKLTPEFGDPRFYRAHILNKAGLHMMALDELGDLENARWLDSRLGELVQKEIDLAIKLSDPAE